MASTSALPPRSASVSSAPGGVASVAGPDTGAPSSGGGSNLMQPKVDLFIRTDNVSLIPIDRDVKAKLRWVKCPFL